MIIDAHQHVWDLTKAHYEWLGPATHGPISRTITEEEALPRLRRCGIDAVVLVQAADNREDTDNMLATAAALFRGGGRRRFRAVWKSPATTAASSPSCRHCR